MSRKDIISNMITLGSPIVITAIFATLKAINIINWNWLWVFSPLLWYPILGIFIFGALYFRFNPVKKNK